MRYTTIIDISEFPLLYRNPNIRLLYLHLCLKSGYHDYDRDILDISIRQLASDVGLTLSATRHALHILKTSSLISMEGSTIRVKKWLMDEKISKRSKNKKDELHEVQQREFVRRQEALEKDIAERKQTRKLYEEKGLTSFILFFEQKYQDYLDGSPDAISSLRRNLSTYLEQCKNLNRKPLITEI